MSNFKKILNLELEYDKLINSAILSSEKNLKKFKKELLLREENLKNNFKIELDDLRKKEILETEIIAENEINLAIKNAALIEKNSNLNSTVDFLLEKIKNV